MICREKVNDDQKKKKKYENIIDWDKPMTFGKIDKDQDPNLHISNPYSMASRFVMKLYTMEFGSPPLFQEANRVSRDMDLTYLKLLGPFIQTLSEITANAEWNKNPCDKISTGEMNGGSYQNMSGAFLLWRGCQMK